MLEKCGSNALKKAGLWNKDDSTGRSQIRIHGLRKFFRSQLALACPVDIVEALMGHEGYLTEAYRRYTIKQMAEYYKKAEHLVTISMPKEITEIESEFKEELNKNRKLIEDLILENRELRERIGKVEECIRNFARAWLEMDKEIFRDSDVLRLLEEAFKPLFQS